MGGGVLLVWGVLAPVGTLTWWLSQSTEPLALRETKRQTNGRTPLKPLSTAKIDCYIVYLPGVGDYSANQLTAGEEFFLSQLTRQHPNCVAVPDVFPYSASNTSLGGQRTLAPVWTAIEQADGWLKNADVLIKIRNLWRFAISADDRYGQVYNQGIAIAVIDRMNAAHPIPPKPDQPLKVILVGTSGGAQVALGAASYLKQWLNPQLIVVSVGGDFGGKVGFESLDQIYHLQGSQDWIEDLSAWLFPSRWGIAVGSPFNQAKWQGRYSVRTIGPQKHDGDQGYFGLAPVANSQTTYVEITLQQVNQLPIWGTPQRRL
jgi:pimeloyl-ACP methyl ester carboxylesterase